MAEIIEKLSVSFQYPFVRYALIAGVLVALCSSLLGVTLVLKRFSFIGDGLSHVAFGAMTVSAIFGVFLDKDFAASSGFNSFIYDILVKNDMPVTLLFTIICAVLLLRTGHNSKINGDAAVAMISVGSLAMGYLLLNLFSTSSNLSGDVCGTLFGSTSILTLSITEVIICVVLSVIVVACFVFFYNKIFAVTFDESFATATGTKADLYNVIIAVIVAVVIVLAMNLVGSLLISALIIFPALSAMRVFKSFKSVTVCSVAVSVFCAVMGILISVVAGTPVGSTIVAADIAVFLIFFVIGKFKGGKG